MKFQLNHITLLTVFMVWFFVRIFPLAIYPGLYSYDAWNHLGYLQAIALENRIPLVDPIWFPYYSHPALHIFSLLLHQFLNLPLMASLQVACVSLVVVSFFVFFILLRELLSNQKQVQISLLILALAPDFLAQTNAAIPELLGLTFFAIGVFSLLRIIREDHSKLQFIILLIIVLGCLFLAHHLTTLMFIITCLGLISGLLLYRTKRGIWNSILVVTLSIIACLFLLVLFDPFVSGLFEIYALPIGLFFIAILVGFSILVLKGPAILAFFTWLGKRWSRVSTPLGLLVFCLILIFVVVVYPVERFILWRMWKFGLLALLLGLVVTILPSLSLPEVRGHFIGSFLILWISLLSISFLGSSLLAFRSSQWTGYLSPAASLAHRHFTYLTIVAAPIAALVISVKIIPELNQRSNGLRKGKALGIIGLFSILLLGGCVNIYYPAGGWHQLWFPQTEIDAGFWIASVRGDNSITYTDARVEALFRGVSPYLPTNNTIVRLNQSVLENPAVLTEYGQGFYFVSTYMENQFSLDFSVPPIRVSIREHLDASNRLIRFYSNTAVTLYHFQASHI